MIKVYSTVEFYLQLLEKGHTLDEISTMNPVRQLILSRGSRIKTFETQADFDAYMSSRSVK